MTSIFENEDVGILEMMDLMGIHDDGNDGDVEERNGRLDSNWKQTKQRGNWP